MPLKFVLAAFVLGITFTVVTSAMADTQFSGKFSDGNLTIELSQQGDGYSGSMTLGQQNYPTTAHLIGGTLAGTFNSSGHAYPFTATLANDTLTLTSGKKTYVLKAVAATPPASPPNPLDTGAPASSAPPANAASQTGAAPAANAPTANSPTANAPTANAPAGNTPAGNLPTGYEITATTPIGQSLLTHKAKITTIKDALEATFPELAQFFGSRPVVGKAFQDAKNPKSGGATFTVTVNGQTMQGFVKCTLDDTGATVAVIYGQSNAPKSEWDKLLKSPEPTAPAANAAAASSVPSIPLKEYDFQDGTGSIGLVDGWTTQTQSADNAILILGPANQSIVLNNGRLINLPDSMAVKNRQQMQQMMQQMEARREASAKSFEKATGRPYPVGPPPPAPPAPPMLVAPQLDPVEALKALIPQFSAESEFHHGPTSKLDQIISSKDIPTGVPNGKSAQILYEMTTTVNGKAMHLRRLLGLATAPMGTQAWFWYVSSGLAAPVETFDHDLPLMQAMVQSFKVNPQRLAEVTQQRNQQMQQAGQEMTDATNHAMQIQHQMFEDNQQTQANIHNQQMQQSQDAFEQHNAQWSNDEWQKQRSAADFQEYILGSRTVVDTQTGQSAQVDLSYANGVAQSLNDATLDPNRFVAVPLRDQLYPTPPPVPGR